MKHFEKAVALVGALVFEVTVGNSVAEMVSRNKVCKENVASLLYKR